MDFELFVVTHDVPHFPKTLDEEKYDLVKEECDHIAAAMHELEEASVDARLYAAAGLGA